MPLLVTSQLSVIEQSNEQKQQQQHHQHNDFNTKYIEKTNSISNCMNSNTSSTYVGQNNQNSLLKTYNNKSALTTGFIPQLNNSNNNRTNELIPNQNPTNNTNNFNNNNNNINNNNNSSIKNCMDFQNPILNNSSTSPIIKKSNNNYICNSNINVINNNNNNNNNNHGNGSSISNNSFLKLINSSNNNNNINNRNQTSNSLNLSRRNSKQKLNCIKTKRSGSITTLLPLRESLNNKLNAISGTNSSNTATTTTSLINSTNTTGLMPRTKQKYVPPVGYQKKRKSNSLSIIDYCNIINMNTNHQMLANFFDDTEESMARLSLKTTKNSNIQKQATISEQMAALFGSSMCGCYLCKMKYNNDSSIIAPTGISLNGNNKKSTSLSTPPLSNQLQQQSNFEITPNKHNTEYSLMKYTYSTPFSQISSLKLFNVMNTDCSIYFTSDNQFNNANNQNEAQTSTAINSSSNTINLMNNSNLSSSTNNSNSNNSSTNNQSNGVNNNGANSSSNQNSSTSSTNQPISVQNYMHINSNNPPIYDSRYLYLIDCRLQKEKFDKSRIHTAIHFSDLLSDSVYLSPPTDSYTLIVLYDDDGTFLTASNNSKMTNLAHINQNGTTLTCDDMISKIKAKINCPQSKTIYILSGGYEQFHSKFGFMCSNLDIRSTVDRHKYLTIYPNCVIENQIYIGSGIQAKNWKIIRDLKITHIINCSIEHECVFKDELKYLHVKLEDTYQENIYKVLNKSLEFIQDAFNSYYEDLVNYDKSFDSCSSGSSSECSSASSNCSKHVNIISGNMGNKKKPQAPVILIHCNLGISRSSSILIAYLISKYKICLYAAFKYVKDKRMQIAPNYSFLRQLKQFEETHN